MADHIHTPDHFASVVSQLVWQCCDDFAHGSTYRPYLIQFILFYPAVLLSALFLINILSPKNTILSCNLRCLGLKIVRLCDPGTVFCEKYALELP